MYAPSPDLVNAAGSGTGIYNTSCDVAPHRNWCHGSLMYGPRRAAHPEPASLTGLLWSCQPTSMIVKRALADHFLSATTSGVAGGLLARASLRSPSLPRRNEQWWTLPRGARAAHLPSWRRPDGLRAVKAAPVDEIMYPQPVTHAGAHLWIGQAGVLRLPQYRVVGLQSSANAVVTTLPFEWPAAGKPLWLNVAASWYGGNVAAGTTLAEKQIGCNEGCAACKDLDTPIIRNPRARLTRPRWPWRRFLDLRPCSDRRRPPPARPPRRTDWAHPAVFSLRSPSLALSRCDGRGA